MKSLNTLYSYNYPRHTVTTDYVIFGFDEGELKILLIKCSTEPYLSKWALSAAALFAWMKMQKPVPAASSRKNCLEIMEQFYIFSAADLVYTYH